MSKLKFALTGYRQGRPNPYGLSERGMNEFHGGMIQNVHPSMQGRVSAMNDSVRQQFRQRALSGGYGSAIPSAAAMLRGNSDISRASRDLIHNYQGSPKYMRAMNWMANKSPRELRQRLNEAGGAHMLLPGSLPHLRNMTAQDRNLRPYIDTAISNRGANLASYRYELGGIPRWQLNSLYSDQAARNRAMVNRYREMSQAGSPGQSPWGIIKALLQGDPDADLMTAITTFLNGVTGGVLAK